MQNDLKKLIPNPNATAEQSGSWSGSVPSDGGSTGILHTELSITPDPRIIPDGVPKAILGPAPAALDEVPLVYGLVAKVLLPRPAFNFKVEHDLPMDVTLVEAKPRATIVGDHIIWNFGRLDPGQELRLQVVVMPEPGAKFNVAELTNFNATYTQNLYFQTPLIKPRLNIKVSGPETVRVGDIVEIIIDTQNIGNWTIEHVRAGINFSRELTGHDGYASNFALGTLDPGANRELKVFAKAAHAGIGRMRVELAGTHDTKAVTEFNLSIID